jgi:hypothetical protein
MVALRKWRLQDKMVKNKMYPERCLKYREYSSKHVLNENQLYSERYSLFEAMSIKRVSSASEGGKKRTQSGKGKAFITTKRSTFLTK